MKKWYVLAAAVGVAVFIVMCGGCGPDIRHTEGDTVTMNVGEYRTFTFTDSYTGDINWLTDDEEVATVNHEGDGGDGTEATVHAVGIGETDMIAIDESRKGRGWHIIVSIDVNMNVSMDREIDPETDRKNRGSSK